MDSSDWPIDFPITFPNKICMAVSTVIYPDATQNSDVNESQRGATTKSACFYTIYITSVGIRRVKKDKKVCVLAIGY